MKKLIFLLLLLLIATPCFGQDMARMSLGIIGGGVTTAGGGYYYPNNITDFPNTSGNIGSVIVVGNKISPGASVTITKLGFYIGDSQSATECSVGIFEDLLSANKLAGCHFSPATSTWGECIVSYTIDSGTSYVLWGGCNSDYKIRNATGVWNAYYSDIGAYVQDMPASLFRTADSDGYEGFRMGY